MGEAPGFDVKLSREVASPLRFAGFLLDLEACVLARESGEAIALTRGEFTVLRMFVARPGRVISRDSLLDAFANRRFEPFDRSVDVLIGKLRRKIEADPKKPRLIVTCPARATDSMGRATRRRRSQSRLMRTAARSARGRSRLASQLPSCRSLISAEIRSRSISRMA
jgi:hypothetical protein